MICPWFTSLPKKFVNSEVFSGTYQLNEKIITQCKNRIHSILKQDGIITAKKDIFSTGFELELANLPLSNVWITQIESLLRQLESIKQETECIKGFSPLTAIALMSDVVDINRFPSAKKFCAYLRTAPRVKSSNEKTVVGKTSKFSRSLSCSLLSQSVLHFSEAGEYLETFYQRVKKGKKAEVYRMAIIRKILVCAYYMLKRDKLFYWVDEKLYKDKLREFNRLLKKAA